jgi:deoxycytidylate deaminase
MALKNRIINHGRMIPGLPENNCNMIAIITKAGRIMSIGQNNEKKGNPIYFVDGYDKAVHAEYDALRKLRHRDLSNYKMYVMYFRKDGSLGNSKPCKHCQAHIESSGLGRTFYIQDNLWEQL